MKRSFFQAAVVSILLYGCTTWTLTKRLERTLDGNYTRMLRAVLNKSWRQHPTRLQLYGHLPPITYIYMYICAYNRSYVHSDSYIHMLNTVLPYQGFIMLHSTVCIQSCLSPRLVACHQDWRTQSALQDLNNDLQSHM